MNAAAFFIALMLALLQSGAAWAHASLVRAEPADGAVLAEPPKELRLTFNEPVSPLVMRLIAPDGTSTTPAAASTNMTIVVTPAALRRGTHVLSWRVISADGHPVGGSLVFSVGEASAQPGTVMAWDPTVGTLLWAIKLVIYGAIFIGIGGAFFRSWIGEGEPAWLGRALIVCIAAGLVATPLSVGLQGLDALDLRLNSLGQLPVWATGLQTSYGPTAVVIAIALAVGLLSLRARRTASRAVSLVALIAAGLALSLSGHASNAPPQALARPSVFVHTVCVAFWVGALLPLAASLASGNRAPLARFTRTIPYALAALIVSAFVLATMQLDRIDAFWTTSYGLVLSCKIVAVAALLAFGAVNRYVLVRRHAAGAGGRPLALSIRAELVLAAAILALVALWRFTPPPRSLATALPIEIHLHDARAMAQLTITPVRAREPRIEVQVFDGELRPLVVKEVTLILANPDAGIEPVRREAKELGEANWRLDGVRIPVGGWWTVRVDLLIGDFEKIVLEVQFKLPRLP